MTRYFYAAGQRRELDLPSGMVVINRASLSDDATARLSATGVAQPVYRYGNALVVFLPEVRVELDVGQSAAVADAAAASTVPSIVTDSSAERLSLRPRSGSAEDALDLANFIYESARPAAATVRMLQIVPQPGTTPV